MITPALMDVARSWPGVSAKKLSAQEVAAFLQGLSTVGQDAAGDWLSRHPLRGASLAWALHQCSGSGWRAVERLSQAVVLAGPQEQRCLLSVLAIDLPEHPAGDPVSVMRLRDALDGVMGERRYLFHIRQPLPAKLDADPVARAVQLWLMAIDRGDWYGKHAVYEDDGISLEISLTGQTVRGGQRPSLLWVHPLVGMERTSRAAQDVAALLFDLEDEADPALPLVTVLAASPRWGLSRGNLLQALYGLPDRITRGPDESHTRFDQPDQGLYGDPMARRLSAVWWVETGSEVGTLRGWCCDNPWCDEPLGAPAFPGRRFKALTRPDALGLGAATLAWEGCLEDWRPQP